MRGRLKHLISSVLTKIISGGQTGADLAGVVVAKRFGLQTGGVMPKGFRTLDGNHPEFAELFGMIEDTSPTYPPRTFKNVFAADGTVRFAANFKSGGEICTMNAIKKANKPHFDVNVLGSVQPSDLAQWIKDRQIKILNVAGNSEKTAPGIGEFVEIFLAETITLLQI